MRYVRFGASLGLVAMTLASCGGGDASSHGTPAVTESPVPTATGAAEFGCLDESGTIEATAAQWYPTSGGAAAKHTPHPAFQTDPEFYATVGTVLQEALSSQVIHGGDAGEEASVENGCTTVRWADLYDDNGHAYSLYLLRPITRVDLATWSLPADLRADGDRVLVGDLREADGVKVVVVAPDGTTVMITVVGADTPPTEDVATAATKLLEHTLAKRSV